MGRAERGQDEAELADLRKPHGDLRRVGIDATSPYRWACSDGLPQPDRLIIHR